MSAQPSHAASRRRKWTADMEWHDITDAEMDALRNKARSEYESFRSWCPSFDDYLDIRYKLRPSTNTSDHRPLSTGLILEKLVLEARKDRVPSWKIIIGLVQEKWSNRCVKCGAMDDLQIHHIRERVQGGRNDSCNLVPLCYPCHRSVPLFDDPAAEFWAWAGVAPGGFSRRPAGA